MSNSARQVLSVPALIAALRQHALLDASRLERVEQKLVGVGLSSEALVRELMRRGWLTNFQGQIVLAGRAHELRIKGYVLLSLLGTGGMGEVYKARQQPGNALVALKRIRDDLVSNEQAVRRFRREVRVASQLNHPNIVRTLAVEEIEERQILVMEYVEGVDLGYYVKKHGPLRVDLACECIRQVALGLQHAQEHGLVHRDIKPSNLMLSSDGWVKILDLGVALRSTLSVDEESSETPLTRQGVFVGTFDYMAPEQAVNARMVDIRSDLYSLGCTWYFLLTGKPPFDAPDPLAKLLQHRLEEPPRLEAVCPNVPVGVAQLVRRLMAKEPANRPTTPAELVALLMRAVQREAPPPLPRPDPRPDPPPDVWDFTGPPEGLVVVPRKRPRRSRRSLVALVVLLLLVGLGAGYYYDLLPTFWRVQETGAVVGPPDHGKTVFPGLDLLARINTNKHQVQGTWAIRKGKLYSPGGAYDRLRLPYRPGASYDLFVDAKRLEGHSSLNIGIPLRPGAVMAMIDGWDAQRLSSLELVDRQPAPGNPRKHAGAVFGEGKVVQLVCSVRPSTITVKADGKTLIDWRESFQRLSLDAGWKMPREDCLFLGVWGTRYEIRRIEVQPYSGEGRLEE